MVESSRKVGILVALSVTEMGNWVRVAFVFSLVIGVSSTAEANPRVNIAPAVSGGVIQSAFMMRSLKIPIAEAPQSEKSPVPAFWDQLKSVAVSNLPKHEDDGFCAIFAPTVISNGFSRTAGLGIVGNF